MQFVCLSVCLSASLAIWVVKLCLSHCAEQPLIQKFDLLGGLLYLGDMSKHVSHEDERLQIFIFEFFFLL